MVSSPFVGATPRLCHRRPEPSSWSTLARETSARRAGRPLLLVSLSTGPGTGRPGSTPFGSTLLGQVPREALGPGPGWREGSRPRSPGTELLQSSGVRNEAGPDKGQSDLQMGCQEQRKERGAEKESPQPARRHAKHPVMES